MAANLAGELLHERFGLCELVRIEGTDWIVQVKSSGIRYRVPPEKRTQFRVAGDMPPSHPIEHTAAHQLVAPAGSRYAQRVIESLRQGLPSLDGSTRNLAVGFQQISTLFKQFLHDDVESDGGGALTLMGHYGQGKTFALKILEEMAGELGFITAHTEIDASENQLNKPHHIYRDLMRNLRLPADEGCGARKLAEKVQTLLQEKCSDNCYQRRRWLEQHLDCRPLAWLLSDPELLDKPELIGLLEGDTNYPASRARDRHRIPAAARSWPAFNAGTQGDFASFLLSGIGQLARLLGYNGFVIIMDEMEKWYELNWFEQIRAGNLLGGLVWAATAEKGKRGMNDHPEMLAHSGRCGGYPFTTERRCHIGLAVAMTPTDDDSEHILARYGRVLVGYVPRLEAQNVREYSRLVLPYFSDAYALAHPPDEDCVNIANRALRIWHNAGDLNTRSGVQAVIAALDEWRDKA